MWRWGRRGPRGPPLRPRSRQGATGRKWRELVGGSEHRPTPPGSRQRGKQEWPRFSNSWRSRDSTKDESWECGSGRAARSRSSSPERSSQPPSGAEYTVVVSERAAQEKMVQNCYNWGRSGWGPRSRRVPVSPRCRNDCTGTGAAAQGCCGVRKFVSAPSSSAWPHDSLRLASPRERLAELRRERVHHTGAWWLWLLLAAGCRR